MSDSILVSVGMAVFKYHNLFSIFSIDEALFRGWLQDIAYG